MSHIFISYSHKDKVYVHKLHEALENEGFDVWIDDRIDYGDKWLKAIEKNLDECDAFIIVMSKNSSESEMVQNEITRARDLEKQIFPLLLDGKNWLVVQSRQFVDVRDGSLPTEKFYKRLESVTPRKNKRAEREAAEKVVKEKEKKETERKFNENKDIASSKENRRFKPIALLSVITFLFVVGSISLLPLLSKLGQRITFTPELELTSTHQLIGSRVPAIEASDVPLPVLTGTNIATATSFFQDDAEPIFQDDFSSGKDWINESDGLIARDIGNHYLIWRSEIGRSARYYIPVSITGDYVELSFRFAVRESKGSSGMWIGLAQNLQVLYPSSKNSDVPGVFINPTSARKIEFLSLYADSIYDYIGVESPIEFQDGWQTVRMAIHGDEVVISMVSDSDKIIQKLTQLHTKYRYVMIQYNYETSGWEAFESGYLDDIVVKAK